MNHKNILIMIDNQNGFTTTNKTKKISKRIVDLSNQNFFDYQIATQYFNNLNSQQNLFTRLQNWNYLVDKKEIDYVDNLKYDCSIRKDIYSCINNEMINQLKQLNNNKLPEYVFLCGMDTECCVLKSCVDLFEIGVIPILLDYYTFSNSGFFAYLRGIKLYCRLVSKKTLIKNAIKSKNQIIDIVKKYQNNFINKN